MKVIEIFDSVDGEGKFAGALATFIRLAGCNLRCRYCDTKYSFDMSNAFEISIEEIVKRCDEIGNRHITLTGGEPLIHKDAKWLVNELCGRGFKVNIETNGSVDFTEFQNDNTIITADYKTPSSGENGKMYVERLHLLRNYDVLKIVCNETDLDDVEALLTQNTFNAEIYLSPIFGEISLERLVDFLKTLRGKTNNQIRVQIQLHKVIWSPNKRGV